MEMRNLPGTEIEVSKICLGTMTFGQQNTALEAHQQLNLAVKEYGVNFIDTAELYPVPPKEETATLTETYIGEWLKDQRRDKVVIASKLIVHAPGMKWFRDGPSPTRENFETALQDSLKRLGTDYIDLYQIHWPARNSNIFGSEGFNRQGEREHGLNLEEQASFMDEFVKAGKIRSWGLSNENSWGVTQYSQLCQAKGFSRPSTIQNAYSLLNRSFESELDEACFRENVGLLAYSPLAMGLLTAKYLRDKNAKGRFTEFPGIYTRYMKPNVQPAIEAYAELADEFEMSPAVMALSFVNDRPFMTSNIIGATSAQQLKENLSSAEVKLTSEQLEKINEVHRKFPNIVT